MSPNISLCSTTIAYRRLFIVVLFLSIFLFTFNFSFNFLFRFFNFRFGRLFWDLQDRFIFWNLFLNFLFFFLLFSLLFLLFKLFSFLLLFLCSFLFLSSLLFSLFSLLILLILIIPVWFELLKIFGARFCNHFFSLFLIKKEICASSKYCVLDKYLKNPNTASKKTLMSFVYYIIVMKRPSYLFSSVIQLNFY